MRPYEVVRCGPPRSPDWHTARRQGIGSSDAANVLGWGKYGSPLRLWLDKTASVQSFDTSHMRMGRRFEQPIAEEWAEQTGHRIIRPPAVLRSRRWPVLAASIDFVTVDGPRSRTPVAPVEVKAVWNGWDEWRDGVPDYYVAQVIHQLIVLDTDLGYVAALMNGEVKSYEVRADAELRRDIAQALTDWWQEHVVPGIRPRLDPIPDRALLDRAVPRPLRKQVDVTGRVDVADWLQRREWACEDEGQAKQQKERTTNALCAVLDDAEELVWDGQVVATWKPNKNGVRSFGPKPLPKSLLDAAASTETSAAA